MILKIPWPRFLMELRNTEILRGVGKLVFKWKAIIENEKGTLAIEFIILSSIFTLNF